MSQAPTPDSSWKGLPSWLFFAFLVIGPPAALVAFTRTLTQNPVLIALLVGGYEVFLFVLRFTGKIWQQLEDPLVKHVAQWFTVHTQEMTSRYYRRYCQYMVSEHQVFDVKGLSTRTAHDLALEQVFVDLRMKPVPSHQASADPLHLSPSLQRTHSIWDYLSTPTLANPHLVVLGAPGSGKTTLLKHLALTLAQPKTSPRRQEIRYTFPILLFLRDHVHDIVDQPDFSLANAVQNHIQRTWQQTMPATWISHQLKGEHCLVLLDGLDEVADSSTRKLVVSWVQQQLIANRGNRFVLTSRPYGYRDNPLDGVTVLDVQAFTSEQVERFVRNWYLANELKSWGKDDLSVQLHAREGTRDLLQRLHQAPALLALAVNPLLLTMVATVHRYRSSLPGKRVDLYAEICEVFLGKRQEARGIAQDLSPAQKQHVLQPLAYSLMQRGMREVPSEEAQHVIAPALALVSAQMQPTDFLRLIRDTSGLLLERNPGISSFAHLTFQEYLAAVHIKDEGLEQVLVAQVANSWWYETIRLYCAQADATALILACLAGTPPAVAALALAFECDEEKLKIQPHAQAQVNAVLEAWVEDPDQERRRVVAEALLTRRTRRMIHLRQETYVDTSLITCAEYQVFLDEQRTQGRYYHPDHWTGVSFPAGSGQTPVLGVRRSDALAFCEWLTARDREGWLYRLPRTEEWPVKEREQWKELRAETGYWTGDTNDVGQHFEWVQGTLPAASQQSIAFAHANAFARAQALDFAIPSAHSRPSNFVRPLDLDPDLELKLLLANELDLARAHIRDSGHAYACTLDKTLDLAHSSARVLARARDKARACDLPSACAIAIDLAIALDCASISDRDLVIAIDRARIGDRDRTPLDFGPTFDGAIALAFLGARALYVMLLLLQERIAGNFPAYEGILLVKERQQENKGSEV